MVLLATFTGPLKLIAPPLDWTKAARLIMPLPAGVIDTELAPVDFSVPVISMSPLPVPSERLIVPAAWTVAPL